MKANINWVTPDLATGGDLHPDPTEAIEQIQEILDKGVTRIIDMRNEWNDRYIWEQIPQVTYLHVPAKDVIDSHLPPEVFDAVVGATTTDDGGRILVHCHMGINRGPSGAFAILLHRGIDPVLAFEMIRDARHEAAIYYAMDALEADQLRRGIFDSEDASVARDRLAAHIDSVWTPEEQTRIAHIIREKHDFDLRAVF